MTCKLIYRESVNILYQSNTFDLRSSDNVLKLPQVMLPHRFQQIRSIRFTASFPLTKAPGRPLGSTQTSDALPQLREACRVLATMTGLDTLEVTIMRNWDPATPGEESLSDLLEVLKLPRARHFIVTLVEPVTSRIPEGMGPLPYIILQRADSERAHRGH
ncbi:unnamed protein product [Zymoseptoria tritici ST99CH_3D7]|uniref:DUF7730 domain-containing protein n=1 Tax=Zymoseptoria tritici (strain ST99CH_3D7) TaxID=1276538 RepID=A0A1X7RIN7_ZYMT9|nr:unnamed protein product [Zymoseptoria tritici ST99CH_3D7]